MLKTSADVASLIARQPEVIEALLVIEELDLPDCWVGAGFVRNRIWDAITGARPPAETQSDIDVVYFDRELRMHDRGIEWHLSARCRQFSWSVKNQARMHNRNGDQPYIDTFDAIRHWPETATAIGARSHRGNIEIIALMEFPISSTSLPVQHHRLPTSSRIEANGWQRRWPQLIVMDSPYPLREEAHSPAPGAVVP